MMQPYGEPDWQRNWQETLAQERHCPVVTFVAPEDTPRLQWCQLDCRRISKQQADLAHAKGRGWFRAISVPFFCEDTLYQEVKWACFEDHVYELMPYTQVLTEFADRPRYLHHVQYWLDNEDLPADVQEKMLVNLTFIPEVGMAHHPSVFSLGSPRTKACRPGCVPPPSSIPWDAAPAARSTPHRTAVHPNLPHASRGTAMCPPGQRDGRQ